MALISTLSLSLLSTNTGIANKWQPTPNDPKPDPNSPPGDVVIKYPQGAFIIVRCSEQTARYLYCSLPRIVLDIHTFTHGRGHFARQCQHYLADSLRGLVYVYQHLLLDRCSAASISPLGFVETETDICGSRRWSASKGRQDPGCSPNLYRSSLEDYSCYWYENMATLDRLGTQNRCVGRMAAGS
jgi:hypothetical protein